MKKRVKKIKKKSARRQPKRGRKLGVYAGKITIPDDFDAPLPDEILDAFEGKSEEEGGRHDSN